MQEEQLEEILKSKEANLIQVPMNPLIQETMDFGGSEMVAGGFNIAGTALVHTMTLNPIALSLAGPVIEKIGFFGWEMLKAGKDKINGNPENYFTLCRNRIRSGMANLAADVCVHDPIYAGLMAYGLTHSQISPELLSVISFLAALGPAASLKHLSSEATHRGIKYFSKAKGFSWEQYYESRFLVGAGESPEKILDELGTRFQLDKSDERSYEDLYYAHTLPAFSGRGAVVRQRKTKVSGNERTRSLEVAYTLPKKKTLSGCSEYNYFYSRKEKGRKLLGESENPRDVKPFGRKLQEATQEISFRRRARYDHELRIALDDIPSPSGKTLYIMEMKVYGDIQRLCEAMDYVMRSYSVRTTTQPKSVLLRNLDAI